MRRIILYIFKRVSNIYYCILPDAKPLPFSFTSKRDIPISKLIGIVFNQFVQYANQLNSRRGPLFEGRFKHILVDKDEYLQVLCRYIHLNPVSAGFVANASDWKYSDYIEWASGKSPYVNDYFLSGGDYVDFVQENQQLLPIRYKID